MLFFYHHLTCISKPCKEWEIFYPYQLVISPDFYWTNHQQFHHSPASKFRGAFQRKTNLQTNNQHPESMCFFYVYLKTWQPTYQNKTEKTYFQFGWCLNPKGCCFSAPLINHSALLGRSRFLLTHNSGKQNRKDPERMFFFPILRPKQTSSSWNFLWIPLFFFQGSLPCCQGLCWNLPSQKDG